MNHTYFLPNYVVSFLFSWQVCFACFSILVLHRGYPSTSQTTCSAMNKRVPKFKREVTVMEGEGMWLGQVIRFADKQPFAFPHLLYLTFVQNSPSYSRGDGTLPCTLPPPLTKLQTVWNWRVTQSEAQFASHTSVMSVVTSRGFLSRGKRNRSQNLTHKLAFLTEAVNSTFLPYFSFDLMFST